MYEEMFAKAYDQAEVFMGPMVTANKLAVANLEKLMSFQVDNMKYYADLGMEQLKEAAAVDSPKAAQAYFNKQMETAGTIREKVLNDTKTLIEMGNGLKEEFTQLAEENTKVFNKVAKPAAKKAV